MQEAEYGMLLCSNNLPVYRPPCYIVTLNCEDLAVPQRQPHRRSGLATLPCTWEPSPSHPILVQTRGLALLYMCIFLLCTILYVYVYFLLFVFLGFPLQLFPSVLRYCWLGFLTCKNRLPFITYTVLAGTLNHAQSNPMLKTCLSRVADTETCL